MEAKVSVDSFICRPRVSKRIQTRNVTNHAQVERHVQTCIGAIFGIRWTGVPNEGVRYDVRRLGTTRTSTTLSIDSDAAQAISITYAKEAHPSRS